MKKLEFIIRHSRFDAVKTAILGCEVHGMTVTEVKGFGRQGGHKEVYRGNEILVEFLPKLKVEIIVHDDSAEKAVEAVCAAAATGSVGDGKIFISHVEDVIRIRTGERGDAAV